MSDEKPGTPDPEKPTPDDQPTVVASWWGQDGTPTAKPKEPDEPAPEEQSADKPAADAQAVTEPQAAEPKTDPRQADEPDEPKADERSADEPKVVEAPLRPKAEHAKPPRFEPQAPPKPAEPEQAHPAEPTPMPKKARTPNLAVRRLKAGFKPSRGQAIVAVVLALVACTAVVQVRVNRADDGYQNARREDLIAILDGLGQNTRRLEGEIAELEERKNTLASSADKAETAKQQAEAQIRALGILAGTVPAHGPGVRITLNDPQGKMTSSNLLDAIEELRDAGAEAIQINGTVRVVASTDFVDDAPGIKIDGLKVTSPYVIEAIGDSHSLAEASNFPGGLVSEVTGPQVGGTADVNEETNVAITALHAQEEHRYARPAPSPSK
ncbi:DUF881 domain-containing protein [Kribbella sp. NPDC056345]|uniref:DUF881 domain-containing protein n=1 Tax=Kribbella sp. NPDC056345 TaxID=3345789 RepID=UPI0035DE3F06